MLLPKMLYFKGGREIFETQQKVITEKCMLHITEGTVRFDEIIEINEDNDVAYMKLPSHNELSDSDNLYDFKMVRRWLEGHLL